MGAWPDLVTRALERYALGDGKGAIADMAEAVAMAGDHRAAFTHLIESARPGPIDAAERLMIALALSTGDEGMRRDLEALFTANRRDARLAELSGASAGAVARLEGLAAYRAGEWPTARSRLEAALEADADDATVLYHLGLVARNLGDGAAAEAWLDRAIDAAPGAVEPLADRGLLAWRRRDDAIAIPLLDAARRERPADL
ncbi:MAG: tetratricopeptide repeat protein, partial [Candidatus Sericytochromatia bacterium]